MSGTPTIRAGFIPLLDAAVLVAAAACGFDRSEGVRLELVREVSWSNIRDRLAFRQFDVAHMLGPMAVASQLGLGSNPYPVIAPFSLGRGGNAITLSTALFAAMREAAGEDDRDEAAAHGRALARVVAARRLAGRPPLVFAMTYPFSSHNYEFRFWMAEAGIDPDRDVTMCVVPPPMTADALKAGAIDGFCVNAPWNALAVSQGIGRIVAVKADIWPGSPEKVLGLRPDWWVAHRETGERLLVALDASARWCDEPGNRRELAEILASPEHVGGDAGVIEHLLAGALPVDPDGTRREIPDYLAFHAGEANVPWRTQALWVYAQMARWGQVPLDPALAERAAAAFRPDLYRSVFAPRGVALPDADAGAGDGEAGPGGRSRFDPASIAAYVEGFAVRARPGTAGAPRDDE
ncbi:CmpA/NrtA family ABC transporter substrate-binding protein [Aureimonas pseudogalii]|uniref:NitT/TauT family transport system ATP-binding protein n=1 Tax=Aureimonas pseudogalii TaxID=1744844 RepID=A0A7W6H7H9_9HYPH|nr:CmpA/NrtA family ABC transporter substrate-binding protein [Aureimonas pseudogalii]MBB3999996.1 NitT/TauT family transport system ATP-binding protein [Aureimonas pseudogalii]